MNSAVSTLTSIHPSGAALLRRTLRQAEQPVIQVTGLVKDYSRGSNLVHALRSVSLQVAPGEFVAVMGPSGSGKSTFMNLVGCLDRPTDGSYLLDGVEVTHLSRPDLADLRNRKLGFIFQGFNLLPRMTALENVMLPMLYAGVAASIRRQRAQVAPAILQRLNRAGATIVLVTHEPDIATYCSRTVVFKDGLVQSDEPNQDILAAAETLASWPLPMEEEEEAA